ncbi:MAG: DUF6655 family protein [Pirellulales bacterium]
MSHVACRKLSAQTALLLASAVALVGCGTTRSTDSVRTATEQLLISDAIDRAVQSVDLAPLRGQTVFLDDSRLAEVVDKNYLVSTLRQHILASGCTLKDKREDADFVVEARAGVVGTDRNDLLFGIPATNMPQIVSMPGVPTAIPEIPLAKRRDQRGVAKISMFAYHRESGRPVWQSGLASRDSSSNDVWLFGAGPFQYGSIMQHPQGMHVARGERKDQRAAEVEPGKQRIQLSQGVVFNVPEQLAKESRRLPATEAVAKAETKPAPSPAPQPPVAKQVASTQAVAANGPRPGEAEANAARKVIPRLTGSITGAELLKNASPKTAEMMLPPRSSDSISLPHPQFDSM